METTALKLTIRITKEELRRLEKLITQLGESRSQVMRRALNRIYDQIVKDDT